MGIEEILDGKREEILRIAARHGAHNVRVFGSVARGDARPDSDVDLLADIERGRGMMDIGRLLIELEELLGRRVDLVEPEGLHWYIRDQVLAEAVPI
ncbi:MAG: nucleotidyltransferase family protein [Acidobacteria bacterium]|nr:nucleotidyltransferase family protein [Acidobacteriota bacterium]